MIFRYKRKKNHIHLLVFKIAVTSFTMVGGRSLLSLKRFSSYHSNSSLPKYFMKSFMFLIFSGLTVHEEMGCKFTSMLHIFLVIYKLNGVSDADKIATDAYFN